MPYENAPATILLATECACCGRPLLDAVSVEAGVGPDCREKYGYGEAQELPDWGRAAGLIAGELADALAPVWGNDQRGAANVLVRAVAAREGGSPRRHGQYIVAIAALGFTKLAAKLLSRAQGVVVEDVGGGWLRVRAPFSPAFNATIRNVPGQRWVEAEKARLVPTRSRRELWLALNAAFPSGTLISGPKGLTVL